MTLRTLMDRAVAFGMEADYRGEEGSLRCRQEEAERAISAAGLEGAAAQRLLKRWPVFGDVAWHTGAAKQQVRRLLVGINMPVESVAKAKQCNDDGWGIDMLFAHHPHGNEPAVPRHLQHYLRPSVVELDARSLAGFYDMPLASAKRIAKANSRQCERWREGRVFASGRHAHTSVQLAKSFGFPFYSCHTPCDNHLFWGIQQILNQQPHTVGDLIEAVLAIPEYTRFRRERQEAPEVFVGAKHSRLGKAWNANTSPTIRCVELEEVVAELARLGFSSIVGVIKQREEIGPLAAKYGLNAVHLPHDPSDSFGINCLLDKLIKLQPLDILCTGDFFRVQRV